MSRHIIRTFWTVIMTVIALTWSVGMASAYLKPDMTPIGPGDVPDYLTNPNWAYSPPLRKFVDGLPGLTAAGANNLGQYIPVAVPDKHSYPGSDYYEIQLLQFSERMHSDLPPTTLRGYAQVNDGKDEAGVIIPSDKNAHYLGPIIIAQKDRPVRVKFINNLPAGAAGDLFVPVDESIMGAGDYQIDYDPITKQAITLTNGKFSQNRGLLHLHGGRTPWISDGTPHQWITPAAETNAYKQGVSVVNVPDMPDPGLGAQTYYWTNQQSARLMFYHDHSWGITRLNVYVGEAAGYLIEDPTEKALVDTGILPADMIPLVIQDKTYVDPATIRQTDPTWIWGTQPWIGTGPMTPVKGDLWWPHVYMPAQNPFDPTGIAPMGRWAYGPYFWPATNNPFQPIANPYYSALCDPANPGPEATTPGSMGGFCQPPEIPSTPNPSWGAEAFMDTPTVNGTAYPFVVVQPKAYRLRILNAAHDRFFNLSIFKADATRDANLETLSCGTMGGCATNSEVRMVDSSASAVASNPAIPKPASWPEDAREGGVPDWSTSGPNWVMIGAEGGFLPRPVVIPPHPVSWNVDVTTFNAGNVNGGSLILAPAERADVVVDFSQYAGQTLILYNDAPAPWPALDPHYDYYTDAPDRLDMGGTTTTPAGLGPNIRTVMQIRVAGGPGTPFSMTALNDAFIPPDGVTDGVFANGQDPLIVGQGNMNQTGDPALYSAFLHDGVDFNAYNEVYHKNFPSTFPNWGVAQINDREIHFTGSDNSTTFNFNPADTRVDPLYGSQLTGGVFLQPKAIQDEQGETFDEFGRMRAALGLTSSNPGAGQVNFTVQTFSDPSTEIIGEDEVQVWKITHNGVDTHPIHFHLFDVQVLDRVGWDGFMRLPDPTEFGWKDTVRISPLEDTIVAVKPVTPRLPFGVPESYRPLNPARRIGDNTELSLINPVTAAQWATPNLNRFVNNDWEYVWHCHILSHEENDMMRAIQFKFIESLPAAPSNLTATLNVLNQVELNWTDATPKAAPATLGDRSNEVLFMIERSEDGGVFNPLTTVLANATTYTDTTAATDGSIVYRYRVYGANATDVGQAPNTLAPGFISNVAAFPLIAIAIASPYDGTNYLAPADVTLTINAQAGIDSVEVFNGPTSLGFATGTSSPFTLNLVELGPGPYALTAQGTNTSTSAIYTSDLVNITVVPSPPIANFDFTGSSAGVNIGICETVNFNGTLSGHSNSAYLGSLTYEWSLLDAANGNAPFTTATVNNVNLGNIAGSYPVTLTVFDSILQSNAITKNVTLVNHPPVANANTSGTPYYVATGANITLTGGGTDVDSSCIPDALTYAWDINNDGTTDFTGVTPTITFAQLTALIGPGTHIISLKVTDVGGASGTHFVPLTIENPTKIISPVNGATLAGATDTFTWTNDGATLYQLLVGTTGPGSYNILLTGGLPAATTSRVVNNLPINGAPVYVRLSARFSGVWSYNDFIYTGFAAPPVASFTIAGVAGGASIATCENVNFNASASTSNVAGGVLTYSWEYNGDTTPDATGVAPASHSFAGGPGSFPVTLTVTDAHNQSTSLTQNVVLVNTAPVAHAGGPYMVAEGGSVNLNGNLSSDADTCDVAPLSFEWDLNNNGTYDVTGVNPNVTYTDFVNLNVGPGVNTIRVRVTDNHTATATATTTVTLMNRNVALATNGAVATASSSYNANFPASAVNNGERAGLNWGSGGGWNDATAATYPDWVRVDFAGLRAINEINVITMQDNISTPVAPTLGQTFAKYGIVSFDVQYWNGTAWVTVPNGSIVGNNQVLRNITFPALTTSSIRVLVSSAKAGYSRIAEIEAFSSTTPPTVSLTSPTAGQVFVNPFSINLTADAAAAVGLTIDHVDFYDGTTLLGTALTAPYNFTWNAPAYGVHSLTAVAVDSMSIPTTSTAISIDVQNGNPRINVAAAANGGSALASSTANTSYAVSSVINGSRTGAVWGAGGGWNDGTAGTYPDWAQVDFAGVQQIDEFTVVTLQDNFTAPVVPTAGMTFTKYGIVDYEMQYWDGAAWLTVPGGSITGNNKVMRSVNFAPISTSSIRVLVNSAKAGYSRIVEIEAYTSTLPPTVSLLSPTNGQVFVAPASITLSADAVANGGQTIDRVEFYDGASLIGTAIAAPYEVVWNAPAYAVHSVTAVAYDTGGSSASTAPVIVDVQSGLPKVNVASTLNGGLASASSSAGTRYPVSAINNSDRTGAVWGSGGGWNDATAGAYPDWVQIDFAASETINEVDVFTLQDAYNAPVAPTLGMTFTKYGITDFTVSYWNGAAWTVVPNGTITGNNKVWSRIAFPAVTTTAIRVEVSGAKANYSRIVEVEAYTP